MHGHTSTSEDDLLRLLNLPEDTQTWTRFDKRAKTYRNTSSSGPLWDNVVTRITLDDKTGHIMSLEYTKHMTEEDLHRNLPSVRDFRSLLLHYSPVTPNQQLKPSRSKRSLHYLLTRPHNRHHRFKLRCRMNCQSAQIVQE